MHAPDISAFWRHFAAQMDQISGRTVPTPAWIADEVVAAAVVVGAAAPVVVAGQARVPVEIQSGLASLQQVLVIPSLNKPHTSEKRKGYKRQLCDKGEIC